jgi:hypothetical protein
MPGNRRATIAVGSGPDHVVRALTQNSTAVCPQIRFQNATLHCATTIRRGSRSEVDRNGLCVTPADRRLASFVVVGRDHLVGGIKQHRSRLLNSTPARDDGRPFRKLRHRPALLVGRENRCESQRLAHTESMTRRPASSRTPPLPLAPRYPREARRSVPATECPCGHGCRAGRQLAYSSRGAAPRSGTGMGDRARRFGGLLRVRAFDQRPVGAGWLVRGLGKTSCHFTEVRLRPATRQTNRSHVFTFIGHSVALDASSPACRLPGRCPGGNRLPISASGFGRGLISVPTE